MVMMISRASGVGSQLSTERLGTCKAGACYSARSENLVKPLQYTSALDLAGIFSWHSCALSEILDMQ